MIVRAGWALVFLFLTGSFLRAQSAVHADADSAAMAEVESLEHHLIDLLARREIDAYAGYLASDYVRVNRDAEVATAAEVLSGFRSPRSGVPASQTPSDIAVRIYGDTAILTFVLTQERGESVTRSRMIKVFVRRNGRWIMVHNQGTPLE